MRADGEDLSNLDTVRNDDEDFSPMLRARSSSTSNENHARDLKKAMDHGVRENACFFASRLHCSCIIHALSPHRMHAKQASMQCNNRITQGLQIAQACRDVNINRDHQTTATHAWNNVCEKVALLEPMRRLLESGSNWSEFAGTARMCTCCTHF